MKKRILLLFVLSLFLSVVGMTKEIAVINLEEIVKGSTSFKKFNEDIEKEKNEIQDLIKKKEEELNKKRSDLEARSSILTKESLQAKVVEFQKEVMAFQDSVRQEESKLQDKLNGALGILNNKINEIVAAMIKEEKYEKYSFVLNSMVFVYYNKDDDLTMEILKRLNKQKITFSSEQQGSPNKKIKK